MNCDRSAADVGRESRYGDNAFNDLSVVHRFGHEEGIPLGRLVVNPPQSLGFGQRYRTVCLEVVPYLPVIHVDLDIWGRVSASGGAAQRGRSPLDHR